jgi:hypothetical protein
MATATTKEAVIELVQKLPDDVSMEAIISELLFRNHVDEGRRQIREGDTVSHEQVRNEMQRWLK